MAKILVADDEPSILDVIIETLEQCGHEVVGVSDGLQALNLLNSLIFDLAILDVMMPKLDGYHLATKIHGLVHPPKVMIISSRNFEDDRSLLNSIGADAFLAKPFSKKELINAIDNLIC